MRFDFKQVYIERIVEINKQIKIAVNDKKWTEKAKLVAEKQHLEEKISKMKG